MIGGDPVIMLEAPLPATVRALKKAGMSVDDIDLFEVNEAFGSVPVAWLQTTGADPARLNVNGGAIALGHPLGASGHQADGDPGPRAEGPRQEVGPADHVRRRRPRQRDDRRAAVARPDPSPHLPACAGRGLLKACDRPRLPPCSVASPTAGRGHPHEGVRRLLQPDLASRSSR